MQVTTETISGRNVVFDYITEDIPGGVNLDVTRLTDDIKILKAGTPVEVNRTTRVAEIVKTGTLLTGSTSTVLYMTAGEHHFEAAEYVTDGRVTSLISSVAASGTTKDAITVTPAITTYAAGTVIVESASTSKFGPVVYGTTELGGNGGTVEIISSNADNAGLAFVITANTVDSMTATYSAGTVTITVAHTTGSYNSDTLVTEAINQINSNEWDFASLQFRTDEWDGDEADATGQTFTLAATTGYKYVANGFIKDDMVVSDGVTNYANLDCSVVTKGAVRNSALPYPLTAKQKAAMTGFTFNY
jgi:hypothetical protein